jgi:uncharacterized membrane-anchored protein
MQRKWLLLAVCLPALAIATGILRAELHRDRAELWQFPVRGYDPRDLLRGQYLNYTIDLPPRGGKLECGHAGECCLCLMRTTANEPPSMHYQGCQQAKLACDGIVQQRYLSDAQRYYVPEARAGEAEMRLREGVARGTARVVLAVDAAGKPQIEELLVDGAPILR